MGERAPCVMLVAAEASGDVLGADLALALTARLGDRVRFVGVGGPRMAEAGVRSPFDIAELSVLGVFEGVRAYPRVVRRADETAALAVREHPDVAVLIDSWGFTLRVAQRLRRVCPGLPIVKYVGPQVWASRPGRARTLARTVNKLLTIHAFDAPWFERAGLPTIFVGNPVLTADRPPGDAARLRSQIGAGQDDPILLVLPGSRRSEVMRLSPVFLETAARLVAIRPHLRVVVPVAEVVAAEVRAQFAAAPFPVSIVEGDAAKADAMAAATAALACSGTVTLELALAGVPMVVAYKVGALSHVILRRLMTTRFITLFNVAADRAVAPEFVQRDCVPGKLVRALLERLDDPAFRGRQVEAQYAALDRMGRGGPNAAAAAAEAVIETLRATGALSAPPTS